MREFLLWSNCTNKCDFCWQCKKHDIQTILNEQDMITCIEEAKKNIQNINIGDDVLLVGGEILNSYYDSVDIKLAELINLCIDMIKSDHIRYFYVNTNLIYKDRKNLIYLLESIKGYEDRLKFTSSFDIYGRFHDEESRRIFLSNLAYIRDNYPQINIVVNSIITKQLVESDFDFNKFQKEYNIKYINFIPYVPIDNDRSMDVSFKDIIHIMIQNEKQHPGYINFYIDDLDLNQDKKLYEYRKDEGFVECTSKYAPCHHNENFKKVLNGECFICKLKEIFR